MSDFLKIICWTHWTCSLDMRLSQAGPSGSFLMTNSTSFHLWWSFYRQYLAVSWLNHNLWTDWAMGAKEYSMERHLRWLQIQVYGCNQRIQVWFRHNRYHSNNFANDVKLVHSYQYGHARSRYAESKTYIHAEQSDGHAWLNWIVSINMFPFHFVHVLDSLPLCKGRDRLRLLTPLCMMHIHNICLCTLLCNYNPHNQPMSKWFVV